MRCSSIQLVFSLVNRYCDDSFGLLLSVCLYRVNLNCLCTFNKVSHQTINLVDGYSFSSLAKVEAHFNLPFAMRFSSVFCNSFILNIYYTDACRKQHTHTNTKEINGLETRNCHEKNEMGCLCYFPFPFYSVRFLSCLFSLSWGS